MKDGGSDRAFAMTVQRDAETQALEINESREQLPSTVTVRNMNLIIKNLSSVCVSISSFYRVLLFFSSYNQR